MTDMRLISSGDSLVLKALVGSRLIRDAKNVFKSHIDPEFIRLGIGKHCIATRKTPVQVHELLSNATFMEIFTSLPGAWSEKWLSQNQVIEFCETFPQLFPQKGSATFFLIKKDEEMPIDENNPSSNLVVVYVDVDSKGLDVNVSRLEDTSVWDGEDRHRVVSPKLISAE